MQVEIVKSGKRLVAVATDGRRTTRVSFRPERGDMLESVTASLARHFAVACWTCWDTGKATTWTYSQHVGDMWPSGSKPCPDCSRAR